MSDVSSQNRVGWMIAPTTYEQFVPLRLRKYGTLLWVVALCLLGAVEVSTQFLVKEMEQIAPWFFITLFTVSLPPILYWVRNQIAAMDELLYTFVDQPRSEVSDWANCVAEQTVSGDWRKWVTGLITAIGGLITLSLVSLPLFHSSTVKAVIAGGIMVKMFFAGTLAYNVLFGLSLPVRIARLPLKANLYQDEFTGFLSLSRLLFSFSLVASFVYLMVFGALTTGPFVMSLPLLIWLALTGLLAGLTIPVSIVGLHRIMRRNKREALVKLAPRLEDLIQRCINDPSADNLEHVQTALQFRNEIANMPEWPIKTDALAAMFTSLLLPVIAIVIEIVM